MSASQAELREMFAEADRRGDRETAMAVMTKLGSLQTPPQVTPEDAPQLLQPEAVPEQGGLGGTVVGALDVAGGALVGLGKQSIEGLNELGNLLLGKSGEEAIKEAQALTGAMPEYKVGEEGQALIKSLSEKYQASPEVVKDIISSFVNIGQNMGDKVLDLTGSPEAATAARMIPDIMESMMGLKVAKAVPGAATVKETAGAVKDITEGVFKYQSKTKQRIAELIKEGSTDIETAKFKLKKPKISKKMLDAPPLEDGPVKPQTKIQEYFKTGGPKIEKDKAAIESIKQGFDEGVIAAIKGSTPKDKAIMTKMVHVMEKGKKNALFGVSNRPSDVVGDSLMRRFNVVQKANTLAGKRLDGVAKSLKGRAVEVTPAVDGFIDDLSNMGISISDDLKMSFKGSDIEGLVGPQRVLTQVFDRMKSTKPPDAYDLHRMKRFIDEQVTYGKSAEGLAGKSERILKKLRRNLDSILDESFPRYDKVNSTYSETINVIDNIQDIAGKKMDLTGRHAEKAVGTLMRRLMSNTQSRIRLLDSVGDIEKVANKYGGKFNDDLLMQVLFVDELDSVFGPAARTSFQGQISQAVDRAAQAAMSPKSAVVGVAAKVAEKARGINQEGAFKAIKRLLERR